MVIENTDCATAPQGGESPAGHRLALKRNEATMRKRQEDEDHQAQRHRGYL